ncbi:MAG: threonine/serine exporter family protein [Bacillota bacterium]|nr:threonine/serine exporter family protein [Bacillota bacterium]
MEYFVQIVSAIVATFGFALIFNVKKEHILGASMGALISWGSYLFFMHLEIPVFFSTLFASMLIGIYGEVMARIRKVPTTIYFMPGCIPLIPGSNLYYALQAFIMGEGLAFETNIKLLVYYALGISLGLFIITETDAARLKLKRILSRK